jgi:hypothetical protein
MKTQSIDTNPKAEKAQISLIRRASIAKRAALMRSISSTTIELSRRAISRANPELNEEQLKIIFAEHHYGPELANLLKEYLNRKGS